MSPKNSKLVYSTDPEVSRQIASQQSKASVSLDLPPDKQTIQIIQQKRGSQGKPVTVLKNFQHSSAQLKLLARDLKQFCGAGGTAKDDTIEIQGDKRQVLAERLAAKGYRIKLG